jgi:hypothetical protein
MFCSSCGKELLDCAKFCAHCGIQAGVVSQPINESPDRHETSFLRGAYNSASQSVSEATTAAKNLGGMLAHQIGDLNNDGKIDAEDYKIAAAKTKQLASTAVHEATKLGKSAMQSDLAKEASAGAIVGAVIAVPVPVIGPVVGATIGASLGAYKHFTKK